VEEGIDYKESLNTCSLEVITAYTEPYLGNAKAGDKFQFERLGYFSADYDSTDELKVFNRTVTLKDSWAKVARK
jgi:glutaminyl-tRNA synthetase